MKFSTMIRVKDGEWVDLESLPKEQARKLINEMMDRAMGSIGFKRNKKGKAA